MIVIPAVLTDRLLVSIYVRRDIHENGMTLKEYADAVMAGTKPILSQDEYVYQFGSIQDEITLVEDWATANNLTIVESGSGIGTVKVNGTIETFNNLFNITLQSVTTDTGRTYITHTGKSVIPLEIDHVVQIILGLDNSVQLSNNAIKSETSTGPILPNIISSPSPVDLALAYKFPRTPGSDLVQGNGACVAIIELGGGWITQNLTSTFSRISQPNPTVVDISVDGAINDGGIDPASAEVMLDIYCVAAVVPAAKMAVYFAPNSLQSFINSIIAATNDTVNNPSVISISWGTDEMVWAAWGMVAAFEVAFQAAAVKGITVFVAAGDYGVKAISSSALWTVQYPATSPYCIAAGGTVVSINDDYSIASEVPWGTNGGLYAGGGGISMVVGMTAWQTGFTSKVYPGGAISPITGRGIPDISAMATGYTFYYGSTNQIGTFIGTSAVAPLLSGMMARLNQQSGRRNGYVTAGAYAALTTAFNDITTGDNHGGNAAGYMATAGWDACTGLGSPIGTQLYKLVNIGETFPKSNYGFRPSSVAGGQAYPRSSTGIRLS